MFGSRTDDAALLELIGAVLGYTEIEELRSGLLEALRDAMPVKWASLNDIGPDRVIALVSPELDREWHVKFAELAHENPIYQRWVRTRDGRAYRFSDVTTRAELEATGLYQTVYKPLGVNHQIAFTLPAPGDYILAVVLHREDRDFTDAERDFLNRARPFLVQIYRNAVAYSAQRAGSPDKLIQALVDHGLTAREAEVVRSVALGGSNRDIAAQLGVSDRTVQKHLERAFAKLGVRTRSAAASRAWQLAR